MKKTANITKLPNGEYMVSLYEGDAEITVTVHENAQEAADRAEAWKTGTLRLLVG